MWLTSVTVWLTSVTVWLTSVTVWLFCREGVAKSPCRCGSVSEIYRLYEKNNCSYIGFSFRHHTISTLE